MSNLLKKFSSYFYRSEKQIISDAINHFSSSINNLGDNNIILENLKNNYDKLSDFEKKIVTISGQFIISNSLDEETARVICAITGDTTNINAYPDTFFSEILVGKQKEYELDRFFYTFRQNIIGFKTKRKARDILIFLRNLDNLNSFNNKDLLASVLSLFYLWNFFENLFQNDKKIILENFLFLSLIIGLPVEEKIKNYIFETNTPFDYLDTNIFLLNSIKNNNEVFLNKKNGNVQVVIFLESIFDDNKLNGNFIEKILEENYRKNFVIINSSKKDIEESMALKLYEFYKILTLLKFFRLVEKNSGGIENEQDYHFLDLKELIKFFFNKEKWNKIKYYYSDQKHNVNLSDFISTLSKNIDLNKNESINYLLEFDNFLHLEKLLSKDKFLIIFDERLQEFRWGINNIK